MKNLTGKVAFITGGASGIGLALGQTFARLGMKVILADQDIDRLNSVIGEFGDQGLAVALDVTDRNQWLAAKAAALHHFGAVDILCNNAGIGPDGKDLADVSPDTFDRVIGVNLTGIFNGITTFAAYLRDRGCGHIVNTASMAGLMANPKLGPYTTAKFAIVGMTEVLRKELESSGVGVSVFCPGLVKTRLGINSEADTINGADKEMSSGMDAEEAVRAVVTTICENRLYAISHKEPKPVVESRMRELLAAFE